MTFEEILADQSTQMVVFACSEVLQPRRLVRINGRRFAIKRQITREQFDAARDRNRMVREASGRSHSANQFSLRGETPENMRVVGNPAAPPPGTQQFYFWAEEV